MRMRLRNNRFITPVPIDTSNDAEAGFNRLIRLAWGRLENQSRNPNLWTQGFGALPWFADEMIWDWLIVPG
jgi:hypothetical protein